MSRVFEFELSVKFKDIGGGFFACHPYCDQLGTDCNGRYFCKLSNGTFIKFIPKEGISGVPKKYWGMPLVLCKELME